MQEWASFFFVGSTVLPTFMILTNESSFEWAILSFIFLLFLAVCASFFVDDDPDNGRRVDAGGSRKRKPGRRD